MPFELQKCVIFAQVRGQLTRIITKFCQLSYHTVLHQVLGEYLMSSLLVQNSLLTLGTSPLQV